MVQQLIQLLKIIYPIHSRKRTKLVTQKKNPRTKSNNLFMVRKDETKPKNENKSLITG